MNVRRLALLTALIGLLATPFVGLELLTAAAPEGVKETHATAKPAATSKPAPAGPQYVDLVICLDTSGSMSGLIESAKQKLWAIVNELATANPKPVLRVALYQYGNDGLSATTGWVQQLSGLTDDLDLIYGKLFPLKTNGGSEYVARVVHTALEDLDWRQEGRSLRMVVVAGNEPATQDPTFKLEDVCRAAANRGITINTLFCGAESEGFRTGWADAARWADGKFAAIEQDRGTVVVNTPYDKPLAELSAELNKTYVPIGKAGAEGLLNQAAQDANASVASTSAAAERAAAKSSGLYNCRWDLIDASKEKGFDLSKVPDDELPAEMRGLTLEQRRRRIEEYSTSRVKLQKEIAELNVKRDAAVQKEQAAKGLNDKTAFDSQLRGAIREQGEKAGLAFPKK